MNFRCEAVIDRNGMEATGRGPLTSATRILLAISTVTFFALGLTLAYVSRSWFPMTPFGLLGSVLCVYFIASSLMRMEIRAIELVAYCTLLWYLGPLTYLFFLGSGQIQPLDIETTVRSGAVALVACSLALPVGIMLREADLKATAATPGPGSLILVAVCTALEFYCFATGRWSYSAFVRKSVTLDVLTASTDFLVPGTLVMTAYTLGVALRDHRGFSRTFCLMLVSLGVGLVWEFFAGRRQLSISMFVAAATFGAALLQKRSPKTQWLILAPLALAVAVSIKYLWKLFFSIRVASYSFGAHAAQIGWLDAIRLALHVDPRIVDGAYVQNVAQRPYIISSLSDFLSYARGHLYGLSLFDSFVLNVPNIFFHGKENFLSHFSSPEMLWSAQLGVPSTDAANTFVLDGYADFSIFGFVIYILVFLGMIRILRLAVQAILSSEYQIFFYGTFATAILMTENTMAGYIAIFRNALAFAAIIFIAQRFLAGRRAPRPTAPRLSRFSAPP